MRVPHPRLIAAGLAAVAAITALTAPPAGAATHPTGTSSTATDRTAVLLNGDRLLVLGPDSAALMPSGSGFAAAVTEFHSAGSLYAVPDAALPYLGRGLDPSLFDVARLPRDGRLPVTIRYHAAKVPALPGITITSAGAGSASGYLTSASARLFGAALARQSVRGHATGTDAMFADGTTISLAGTRPPAQSRAGRYTLTLHGTTLSGAPDTGDEAIICNMDKLARVPLMVVFSHGTAKVSVPAGHYVVTGVFDDKNSSGHVIAERVVTDSAVTVTGSTSTSLAERTATSRLSLSTPRPTASSGGLAWVLWLTDKTGASFATAYFTDSTFAFYVSPTTRRPVVGSLHVVVSAWLASALTIKMPYEYDLSFADPVDVISSQQHYVASSANTATIVNRYYTNIAEHGLEEAAAEYGFEAKAGGTGIAVGIAFPSPGQRVEYVSAGGGSLEPYWGSLFIGDTKTMGGGEQDSNRGFTPGQQVTEDWNAYPLHSSLNTSVAGSADPNSTILSATRSGDDLSFDIYPFGDNTPGHYGSGYWPGDAVQPPGGITGSYELDENGHKIASGNPDQSLKGLTAFEAKVAVSKAPAMFKLTLNASRPAKTYGLSAKTSTTWTWRSSHESGSVVPVGWVCPGKTRNCAAQPLMTLNYNVAGLALNGTAPAGGQLVSITVGHQQTVKGAPVSGLGFSFSTNGGRTWQPVTVAGGSGGSWQAAFKAPAGTRVSLRVTATDKAGGAISETVTTAYAIGG
jgi:hypothetical protein